MLRGYRGDFIKTGLAVLAIIGALAFGLWSIASGLSRDAEFQRQADDHSRKYAAYAQEQIRENCFPLSGVHKANCISEKRHDYREDRREERDLVAQRNSANWAYIMGAAAVLGMVLSAVGVVLVWITFRETRRTAQIAYDALEHEKATALAINRPWLGPQSVNIGRIEAGGNDPNAGGVYFQLRLTNFGNSPATDVFMFAEVKSSGSEHELPDFGEPAIENANGFTGMGLVAIGTPRGVSAADTEAWKQGNLELWMYGVARYSQPGVTDRPYGVGLFYRLVFQGMRLGDDGVPIPLFLPISTGPKNQLF